MRVDSVEVIVEGAGPKAIVMIHGWPDTHRLWDGQVEALKARYRCVRFTLPGFDLSGPRRAYSLDELLETMRKVVEQVRAGQGPFFIEAMTYRFMGHSMSDPAHGHYRTKVEVEEHRKRDPLLLLKQAVLSNNLGAEADFTQIEREVGDVVTAAVRFADESPFPAPSALYTHVIQEE